MKADFNRRRFLKNAAASAAAFAVAGCADQKLFSVARARKQRPNILWLIAEDMSPNWSCCGETTIRTPNIDRLAAEGLLFRNAFVTAPVCSPSRSAMITGMYQTTIGAHHHRSSYPGSEIHLPENIKPLPAYFKQHGYYTTNGGPKTTRYATDPESTQSRLGKTDYNFVWDASIYDGNDWKNRAPGQPFFAQIQLRGGKYRNAKVPDPVDPADVTIPPYYPDHPVIRRDWANYLNSVLYLDIQVGKILQRLEREGIADSTAVFLWTDHGISHARGKQFLYDEGIRVPLIIRLPGVLKAGAVCDELVSHIDIPATSLYIAGIPVPEYMQGRPLFGPDATPRKYIFAARDRCDETLDCIRCVRTRRYKYIRNFYPRRPHLQPNRYKDNKQIIKTMRNLHAQGRLNPLQAKLFAPTRPAEELYDLRNDPYEIHNLAHSPQHRKILEHMRDTLIDCMRRTNDLGLVPEPVIERFAARYQSRCDILKDRQNKHLLDDILEVIELGEKQTSPAELAEKMKDPRPSIRWWAARKLSAAPDKAMPAAPVLTAALSDTSAAVRVASARTLCIIGQTDKALPVLTRELSNSDQVVRHYAALALEDIGNKARPVIEAVETATNDKYEYVKRLTSRLTATLQKENPSGR